MEDHVTVGRFRILREYLSERRGAAPTQPNFILKVPMSYPEISSSIPKVKDKPPEDLWYMQMGFLCCLCNLGRLVDLPKI